MSISHLKAIILLSMAMVLSTVQVYAGERSGEKVPEATIAVYNFKPAENSEKYQYYSNIIPHTLARTLKKTGNLKVERSFTQPEMLPEKTGRKAYKEWAASHVTPGGDGIPDFALAGTCSIIELPDKKKLLRIQVQVINIRGRESVLIQTKSEEVGAILKTTIDDLGAQIQDSVRAFQLKNMKRFAPSPFMPVYSFFRGMSFGIKTGMVYMTGDWEDLYNDTDYVNAYIMLNTSGRISLALNCSYFSSDNYGIEAGNYSIISVWSSSADIAYNLYFSRRFYFSIAAGGGMAFTNIKIHADNGPFTKPLSDTNSTDPFAAGSLSFHVNIDPVRVQFGSSIQRIFFQDTHMQMITFFFGAGFKI